MPKTSATSLMFIHCLSATHPGSGTALGVVDLPVQRECHTLWPTVPGSTLKGCLRAVSEASDGNWTRTAFGPPVMDASAHAGALSISDARLLAFPVRSLKGVFAWTTCPAVLDRLRRDLALADRMAVPFPYISEISDNHALCPADSSLLVDGEEMLLEEFDFKRKGDCTEVANWVADNALCDEGTARRLRTHLVVLSDDKFCHFVRYATEISARISLDSEKRTVKSGALFWEEHLPPETLFYALVTAHDSRRAEDASDATAILRRLCEVMPPTLQIGGNATLGKGLCAVRVARQGEGTA